MVPVDGSYTLNIEGMIEVIEQIRAPLIIPMHFFSLGGLERFLGTLKGAGTKLDYAVEFSPTPKRGGLARDPAAPAADPGPAGSMKLARRRRCR